MSNSNSEKKRFYGLRAVEIQEADDKDASFLAVASTSDVGRDGHIVKADGWALDNYVKNPIVPFAHSTSRVPVAKSIETKVQGKRLMFRPRFAVEMPIEGWPKDVPHPSILYPLYTHGYLNAFSVSWEPIEMREMDEKEKEKYLKTPSQKFFGGLVFEKQELLEISVVPLPADPKALKRAYSDGIDSRACYDWLQAHRAAAPSPEDLQQIEKPLERFYLFVGQEAGDVEAPDTTEGQDEREVDLSQGQEDPDTNRAAVPYAAHGNVAKADEGKSWNASQARRALAKWASSDGSGDTDTIDWKKYRLGFAWYDSDNAKILSSYKFPHHTVTDGTLTVVWRGVAAAMQRLLSKGGTQTTVPEADRRGIYNHLKKEYARFDKTPPEFRDYEPLELARQFDGVFDDITELLDPEPESKPVAPSTFQEAQERMLKLLTEHREQLMVGEDIPSRAWDEFFVISQVYEAEGRQCPDLTGYEDGELGLMFHDLGDKPLRCFSTPDLIEQVYAEDDSGTRIVRQCACGTIERKLVSWDDTPIWKLPTDAGKRLVKAAEDSPDKLVTEANAIFAEQHQKYMARAKGAVLSTTFRAELERVVSHLTGVLEAGAILPETSEADLGGQQRSATEKVNDTDQASQPTPDDQGGNAGDGKVRSGAANDGDVWEIELEDGDTQPDPADAQRTSSTDEPPADTLEYDLTAIGGVEGLADLIGKAVNDGVETAIRRRAGALE